jgi:mannose-1-phosphate guanylyltransferase
LPASTKSSKEPPDTDLWITVLAGGVGSRFWPVSTPTRPKQLLPLASDRPLIVDTIERARSLAPDERIRVLAPAALLDTFAAIVPSFPREHFWTEPKPRGTAPALASAAWRIHREHPRAVIASLHADHVIRPLEAFRNLIATGAEIARREALLLTVGVPPSRPDVSFGYVQPGAPLETRGDVQAFRVDAFHEKPDADTAARYVSDGYLWNSGIFIWSAAAFLEELDRHTPEVAGLLPRVASGDVDGFFEAAPDLTVDIGVLERSDRVGVLRASFEWDDVGSWDALARNREPDAMGNVRQGDAHLVDASGNVVFTDGDPVVLFGVKDLVVVRTEGVTLVLPRARAADLKSLLERLPESLRRLDR